MRFDRLDILRYGALTDRRLSFRPDANLHIVYGPNEAGKSSALSAISDLLFGFPERSEYGFLHDPTALRVGARIRSRAGDALEFRRRKGRKNTVLAHAEAEEPLLDDALTPYLGTLSRDVFQRAFGLNSDTLRAGGKTMLTSGGEIGSLLFSAASGLTGLSNLRKSLETEADTIYSQRKSKDRRFYQVLDAHDAARKAERENELKASDWKKLIAEESQIATDMAAVQSAREQTRRALDRLHRLSRLEPILREIDRETERLSAYAGLSSFSPQLVSDLASLLEEQRAQTETSRLAELEVTRLLEEIEAVRVDSALLDAAPQILALHAQSGAYLNARQDSPRVVHEVEDFNQRLTAAARRLGFAAAADLDRAQPADADLVRLRDAVTSGQELDRDLKLLTRRLEEERDALRDLEADIGAGRFVDPKPWADQLAALRPDFNELSAIEALKVRLSRAQGDLATAASKLDPPVSDIAAVLASRLPDLETLSGQRREIEAAKALSLQASQKRSGLVDEAETVATQIAALEIGGEIVARETILAARARRDELLGDLQNAKAAAEGFRAAHDAVSEADRLADLALSDAERVSRHAQLALRQRELEQRITRATAEVKEADIAVSDATTEFGDLFHAVPISLSTPERMIEWRRGIDQLTALAVDVDDARDALEVLTLKEADLKPAVMALADAIGVGAGVMPLRALARELERRVEELAASWNDRRALERLRQEATRKLAVLEEDNTRLRRDIDQWRLGFSSAASLAGLAEDASLDMALAALDVWRTVPAIITEKENRERRVRGMARDMQNFEDAVSALVRETATDLSSLQADAAAGMLHDRLNEARAADNRKATLSASHERAGRSMREAQERATALQARLSEFAEKASIEVAGLDALLADLDSRAKTHAVLDQGRARFLDQADGLAEADVRQDLDGFDRVTASVEMDALAAEDGRQVERLKELGIAQAENERRRRELETGMGAERAVFEKLSAEEEARELARRWVVLKLAGAMLGHSMEAYREQQADPVMTRAGEVFSDLTGGRFVRLVQVYDESDELQLAVERRTGEQVPLSGLSEGTGDQLYLALRLAFLSDYCRRNEPAPLILDDIFQTFDDERTAAGLQTLARSASSFQTVLFTHQMSLVETAERELGTSVDLIRLDRT